MAYLLHAMLEATFLDIRRATDDRTADIRILA